MELRPGYKKTEVGVIPDEWEIREIAGVGPIQTGPFGTVLKASEYSVGDGVPLISVGEIKIGQIVLKEGTPRVNVDVVRRLPRYVLREGDILFGRKGAVDRSALVYGHQDGWFLGSDGIRLRPTNGYSSAFLAYQFQTAATRHWLRENSVGTTMPSLNERVLSQVTFACPPDKVEQEAIAEVLSDVDASVSALSRLIAKKRDQRLAAIQRLLTGQTRLPGFTAPWVVRRLGELGEIRSGGTPSTANAAFWDGGIPWCTPTDITALSGKKTLQATSRMISAKGLSASSAEIIPPRSLIMTTRATIGACAINSVPMTTNQGFKNIVPNAETDVDFLYYFMSTQTARLVAICGGSTFLEIGKRQLSGFEVTLPDNKVEQTALAAILSDLDTEIAALEARLDKTGALKQAMMQALLTGRVRLPVRRDMALQIKEAAHA